MIINQLIYKKGLDKINVGIAIDLILKSNVCSL